MEKSNKSEARANSAAPSEAELQALGYWRYSRGRYWKRDLSHAWRTGEYPASLPGSHPALLQGLRNRLGPTWLANFSLKDRSDG